MKIKLILLSCMMIFLISSCKTTDDNNVKKTDKPPLPPFSPEEKELINKLGGKITEDQNIKIGEIIIHRRENELSFPAKMCITDSGEYGIEVLISLPNGRIHEALLTTEVDPVILQLSLYLIGAENGARIPIPGIIEQGSLIGIDIEPENGIRVPVEDWLFIIETEKKPERGSWVFVGSSFRDGKCLAKEEGNIVNVLSMGNTILDNESEEGDEGHGLGVNDGIVPKKGTPVTVYFYLSEREEERRKQMTDQ